VLAGRETTARPPTPPPKIAAKPGGPPPGSWTCAGCGNLNWPQREKCNTRDCKAARPEVMGPAATVPADRQPARPAALVLAPTRELAQQISEVARLAGGLGVSVACLYGGVGKGPQAEALYVAGAGLVVGTPGRV
jgi:hypothetical protein